ncbi:MULTISPECIES: hypothetical protein [Streptomyces]|nr:hypothetical protein [Streptomyces sp. MNU77]
MSVLVSDMLAAACTGPVRSLDQQTRSRPRRLVRSVGHSLHR